MTPTCLVNKIHRTTAAALILAIFFPYTALSDEITKALQDGSTTSQGTPQALDCIIEPSEVVEVGASEPGVIEAVYVDRADPVKAGALVARLESGVEQATVNLARAKAALTTTVELRQVGSAFGLRQQERNEALFRKNILPANDMDKLQTEARLAKLQQRQAEDELRLAALELQRAEATLKRRTIVSPVNGVVMERHKSAGEYIKDQPVMRIAQLDPLHVEVIAPVELFGKVKAGMQADVKPEPQGDGVYRAHVTRVDPVADPASGTFGVRLALPNPDYHIAAGLRCHLQFVSEEPLLPVSKVEPPSPATPPKVDQAPAGSDPATSIPGPVASAP